MAAENTRMAHSAITKSHPGTSLYNEAYPMFIRRLNLQNVLSFRESAPLELRRLNILIGPNGSGKSNLVDCMELLHWLPQGLNRFLGQRGGADAWIWKGRRDAEYAAGIECELALGEQKLDYEIAFSALEGALVIQREALWESSVPVYLDRLAGNLTIRGSTVIVGPEAPISRFESAFEAYRNPTDPTPIIRVAAGFAGIRVYRTFHTSASAATRIGISSAAPKHPLEQDGSNLALVLQEMDFHGSLSRIPLWGGLPTFS